MIAWQSVAGLLSCVRLVFSKLGNCLTLDLKDLLFHVLQLLGFAERERRLVARCCVLCAADQPL